MYLEDNPSSRIYFDDSTVSTRKERKTNLLVKLFVALLLSGLFFGFIYNRYFRKNTNTGDPIPHSYLQGAYEKFPSFPDSTESYRGKTSGYTDSDYQIVWETQSMPQEVANWYLNEAEKSSLDWLIMKKPESYDSDKLIIIGEYLEKEFRMTVNIVDDKTRVQVDFPKV